MKKTNKFDFDWSVKFKRGNYLSNGSICLEFLITNGISLY